MEVSEEIKKIEGCILNNNLDTALDLCATLLDKLNKPHLTNQLLLISSRFHQSKSDERKGILSRDEYVLEVNRIKSSLLNITNELKKRQRRTISPKPFKAKRAIFLSIGLLALLLSSTGIYNKLSHPNIMHATHEMDSMEEMESNMTELQHPSAPQESTANIHFAEMDSTEMDAGSIKLPYQEKAPPWNEQKLLFNITDKPYVELVFTSKALRQSQRIKVPTNVLLRDLKKAIIENYDLKQVLMDKHKIQESWNSIIQIEWVLVINHREIMDEMLSISDAKIESNDILHMKARIAHEYSASEGKEIVELYLPEAFHLEFSNTIGRGKILYKEVFDNNSGTIIFEKERFLPMKELSSKIIPIVIKGSEKTPSNEPATKKEPISSDSVLIFPNAFSPRGDGINDFFTIPTAGMKRIKTFKLYNRWGDLIISSSNIYVQDKDYQPLWDGTNSEGKSLPMGTYYYILEVETSNGEIRTIRGDIMILR